MDWLMEANVLNDVVRFTLNGINADTTDINFVFCNWFDIAAIV